MTETGRTRLNLVGRVFVGFEHALAAQIAHFQRTYPDVEVIPRLLEPQDLYEQTIAQNGLDSGDIDLTLTLSDWLSDALQRDLLAPLDAHLARDPLVGWPDDWSPSLRGIQRDGRGHTYALPYHDGPMMLIYRRDLFTDPAEQAAFRSRVGRPLQPPTTWSDYRDVAQFFTRPERQLYGAVAAGLNDGHNTVYDFLIHTWSRGGRVLDAGGQPVFDEPIAVAALQYHVDLFNQHKVMPPDAKTFDSVASGAFYARGHAAMMVNWCGFATMAEVPEQSCVVGKNGLGLVPRGEGPHGVHTSINVYWVLAIPRASRHKDLAYAFMRLTASPDMDQVTARHGCIATRLSTWRDPQVLHQFPVYATIEQVHRNVNTPPPLPTWPALADILNRAVDDALHERKSVREALRWATAQAQVIHWGTAS